MQGRLREVEPRQTPLVARSAKLRGQSRISRMGNLSFEGGRVPWILFGMFRLIQEWTTSRCANATIVNTTPVFSCRHIAIDSLTHSPTGTCKKRD